MQKESPLGNTVGLVVELLREHLIEVLKLLILQNLCVKPCNTVNRISRNNCKMSHLNLTIIYNSHLTNLLIGDSGLSRILHFNKTDETAVNLFYNLVYTGKQTREQLNRPLLKSFRHNCMIGICTGFGSNIPCLVPT